MALSLIATREGTPSRVWRTVLTGVAAIILILAMIPLNATAARLFDSKEIPSSSIHTGSMSVGAVPGSTTAVLAFDAEGEDRSFPENTETSCTDNGTAFIEYSFDASSIDGASLAPGDVLTVSQDLVVDGSGTNLQATLSVTVDPADLPKGVILRSAQLVRVSSPTATHGTVVDGIGTASAWTEQGFHASSAELDTASLDVTGIDIHGAAYYRVVYVLEYPAECEATCELSTGALPLLTADLVQDAR